MSAVVFAFERGRSEHRPWHNSELAEFYRAIEILGRAGLAVVPDMGVSDEGDPWFAFCRSDTGDVVVHFARIDGMVVAQSVASKDPVRGAGLRNIIDSMLRKEAALALPPATADRRIFLHPAVVLTAFIAAALAFSKHADAHESHHVGAAKAVEPHSAFGKLFAGLKAATGEVFGAMPAASADGGAAALNDPTGIEASISLSALISAAISVLGPAADLATFDHDLPTTGTALALPPQADGHSSLRVMEASLLAAPDTGNGAAPQPDVAPLALWTNVPKWHGAGDMALGAASLALAATTTDPLLQPTLPAQPPAPPPAHAVVSADNILDHLVAQPLHFGTIAVAASSTSSGDQTPSAPPDAPDPMHGIDLSTISPIALAILLGTVPTDAPTTLSGSTGAPGPADAVHDASQASGGAPLHLGDAATVAVAASAVTVGLASSSAATSAAIAPTTASLPAAPTPNLIVVYPNPAQAIEQIVDYGLTSHPISGTFAATSTLAASLPTYMAEVSQPVRMIVFDSATITVPVFELTKGVVFVNDHALGITPAQAEPANVVTVVANGGVMVLLGVVDSAHVIL